MAEVEENTAVDELIRSAQAKEARISGRTEANLRPRAITTTMPLPMEPLRRRPQATPPIPTRRAIKNLPQLVTTDMVPALPAYVPAPDIGDPAESDATVPVEQYDFTELVDRHRVYAMPERTKSPLRFLPWVGVAALAAVFVGGYLMFDGESTISGRQEIQPQILTPVAPPELEPEPVAVAPVAVAAPAEPTLAHEPTETAKVPSLHVAPPADDPAAPAAVEAPKPPRTAVYVTSNKPVQIFVDGKSANATAPRKLYLSPGPHKITLWDTASGKTESIQVNALAGKVTALDKSFR